MAKVSNASHDAPPTTRSTRSTRSQSHDPTEQPTPSKKSAPKGKKGGKKGKSAATADLTTVDEVATVEEEQQPQEEQPQDEQPQDEQPQDEQLQDEQVEADIAAEEAALEEMGHARRASAHSGMSGTTAKTSFSIEEIEALDSDVMVDVLPNLSFAADELANLLVPDNDPKSHPVVRKEIRTQGTKHNKLYHNRISSLRIHKDSFGSTEYLQPSIILRKLLGVESVRDIPQGPWRPDNILYSVNLSLMLKCILVLFSDNGVSTKEGYDQLEDLVTNFGSAIAGPEFRPEAFDMCLALLTQLCIVRIGLYWPDPNFEPTQLINETFWNMDDKAFRHRKVLHLTQLAPEEEEAYEDVVLERANAFYRAFGDRNRETWQLAFTHLKSLFPWAEFVDHTIGYYIQRKQTLDEQIAAVGGTKKIIDGLSQEVSRRQEAMLAEAKRESFSRPGGTPKKSFGKGGIKALKAREKQLAASTAPAPAAPPVAQMVQPPATADDGWQRPDVDDELLGPTQSSAQVTASATLEAIRGLQGTQKQKAKGRSFVDRQPNAQRVEFDEDNLTQYSVPPAFQYPASSTHEQGPYYQGPQRKRPYPAEDNEEDEDEAAFEADDRSTTAADARRLAAPKPRLTAAPQPDLTAAPQPDLNAAPQPHLTAAPGTPSPSKRPRRNPGSTIPSPPAPFDPDNFAPIPREDRMQRAKVAARHGTIRASQHRPPQVRAPWTREEENALIDLIEAEASQGISYSKLKSFDAARDALLARRSPEDLRFKARNMKQTFLTAMQTLPKNFEFIVLDKKAIARLHSYGIPYQQERIRGPTAVEVNVVGE